MMAYAEEFDTETRDDADLITSLETHDLEDYISTLELIKNSVNNYTTYVAQDFAEMETKPEVFHSRTYKNNDVSTNICFDSRERQESGKQSSLDIYLDYSVIGDIEFIQNLIDTINTHNEDIVVYGEKGAEKYYKLEGTNIRVPVNRGRL
jgi:hypothetical protein